MLPLHGSCQSPEKAIFHRRGIGFYEAVIFFDEAGWVRCFGRKKGSPQHQALATLD